MHPLKQPKISGHIVQQELIIIWNYRALHFPSVLLSKRKFQVELLTKIVIAGFKCWNRELLLNLLFAWFEL